MKVKKLFIIIAMVIITVLSLSGVVVAIVYQIYLQMQKFGAVINEVHIWNLCDLFALTVFGLLGDFALLIKLEEINEKIKWEEQKKRFEK
nr:MAG TPA: hypothetical protein [Caudoviricetes sp.]